MEPTESLGAYTIKYILVLDISHKTLQKYFGS